MDFIINIDKQVFFFLNSKFVFSLFDIIFPILTNWYVCFSLVLSLVLGCAFCNNGKYRYLSLCIIVAIVFSDIISSHIIKKTIKRLRPCCSEESARLLVKKSRSYSFPSSHSTNGGSVLGVVISELPTKFVVLVGVLVMAIAYSRVYVGVHYPLDVLCGLIIGIIIGRLVIIFYKRFYFQRFIPNSSSSE